MARIIKGETNDVIIGTDGSDFIIAGNSFDVIIGGKGRDLLYGGSKSNFIPAHTAGGNSTYGYSSDRVRDVFVFNEGDSGIGGANRDVIRGFEPGVDKIDLSSMGYELNFRIQPMGDKMLLKIDADHNGTYEMQIAIAFGLDLPYPAFSFNDLILA